MTLYCRKTCDVLMTAKFIRSAQYDAKADAPVAVDYDGDGKTDIAVRRDGIYHILQGASGLTRARQFGAAGDVPTDSAFSSIKFQSAHLGRTRFERMRDEC